MLWWDILDDFRALNLGGCWWVVSCGSDYSPALRVFPAETRLTVYCWLPYGTSAGLVPNDLGQRPTRYFVIGDEYLMENVSLPCPEFLKS